MGDKYTSPTRDMFDPLFLSFLPSFPLKGPPHYLTLCQTFWLLIWRKNFNKNKSIKSLPKKSNDIIIHSSIHSSIHPSSSMIPPFSYNINMADRSNCCHMFWAPFLFFVCSDFIFPLWSRFVLKPIFVCMFMFVRVSPLSCCHWGGAWLGLGCAFVGWASGLESVSQGSIRAVSSLTLILCTLVSSVISLSFFLRLLSVPCPDLECIASVPCPDSECIASVAFFFVPELGSLLFYVLIGRGWWLLVLRPCLPVCRLFVFFSI